MASSLVVRRSLTRCGRTAPRGRVSCMRGCSMRMDGWEGGWVGVTRVSGRQSPRGRLTRGAVIPVLYLPIRNT